MLIVIQLEVHAEQQGVSCFCALKNLWEENMYQQWPTQYTKSSSKNYLVFLPQIHGLCLRFHFQAWLQKSHDRL